MFWRVSTYSQQTPADAILDKGHVILEDLLEVEDLAKVRLRRSPLHSYVTGQPWQARAHMMHEMDCIPRSYTMPMCCLTSLAPTLKHTRLIMLLCPEHESIADLRTHVACNEPSNGPVAAYLRKPHVMGPADAAGQFCRCSPSL